MTELTSLTLGEARDGLRSRRFSAVQLADAHLAAMETARALNAYVLETPDQARAARTAHLRFGKGTGHGAGLNSGDCFAYGLAKAMDAPLLCKGNDFPLTDVSIA